jgi:hypothetical protein
MSAQEEVNWLLKHKLSPWEHGFAVGLQGNENISARQQATLQKMVNRHSELSEKNTTDTDATAPSDH